MDIIRKDATITNTDDDGPRLVRGDPVGADEGPRRRHPAARRVEAAAARPHHLRHRPRHDVATTVGSGVPRIDEETGNLSSPAPTPRCRARRRCGRWSTRATSAPPRSRSCPRRPRRTASRSTVRELLNGAFVAIPSNREALVLASKASRPAPATRPSDAEHIQAIHDHALALGATARREVVHRNPRPPSAARRGLDLLAADVDLRPPCPPRSSRPSLSSRPQTRLDELLDALGVTDPDEDAANPPAAPAAAPAKAAAPAETTAADDDAELQTRVRALA
jgi:hypothetical protein